MKAIRVHEFGGPEVLKLEEVDIPKLSAGEVLVRVEEVRARRTRGRHNKRGRPQHGYSRRRRVPRASYRRNDPAGSSSDALRPLESIWSASGAARRCAAPPIV